MAVLEDGPDLVEEFGVEAIDAHSLGLGLGGVLFFA